MEAKDTVTSREKQWEISTGNSDWTDGDIWDAIAQAQAEISYKAGYNQALKEHEWDDNYYKGKKIDAGIKEVVEFIDWLDNGTRSSGSWRSEMRAFRQAKLKEWGINEETRS